MKDPLSNTSRIVIAIWCLFAFAIMAWMTMKAYRVDDLFGALLSGMIAATLALCAIYHIATIKQ